MSKEALDLDENGCAPDCPIRILGEMSGVSKSNIRPPTGKWDEAASSFALHRKDTIERGHNDTGTAARYFAQFYPDDETPQERGETQLLNSDEVMSGDLPIDQVLHGDCLEVLKTLPDNSVDSICTDPPYGMGTVKDIAGLLLAWIHDEDDSKHLGKSGFMGKEWDAGVPGPRYWREALRVLKPGGHLFAFSSTRTYDLLVIALRLAGFECRDQISWLYGSGFPKSLNLSAAIDKHLKAEREVIGPYVRLGDKKPYPVNSTSEIEFNNPESKGNITAPATDLAKKYAGYGSALKPSHEPICLARKPLAEKTIAAQVLATGTGALNIAVTRVGGSEQIETGRNGRTECKSSAYGNGLLDTEKSYHGKRFPSNTLFSHSSECVALGEKRVRGNRGFEGHTGARTKNAYGEYGLDGRKHTGDSEGMETVPAYSCAPDCPVAELDRQSGVRKSGTHSSKELDRKAHGMFAGGIATPDNWYGDTGTAARYFKTFPPVEDMVPFTYQSKASRRERNSGCEALPEHKRDATHLDGAGSLNYRIGEDGKITPKATPSPEGNHHPTVKPISLMSYLIRMITPPNGIVLDFFAGSGSTGVAAVQCGFHYILIEQEAEYVDIIRARLAHAHASVSRPVEQEAVEYDCAPGCPVHLLGEMSGVSKSGVAVKRNLDGHTYNTHQPWGLKAKVSEDIGYGDTGTASRYFKTFPPEPTTLWDMAEEEVTPHA